MRYLLILSLVLFTAPRVFAQDSGYYAQPQPAQAPQQLSDNTRAPIYNAPVYQQPYVSPQEVYMQPHEANTGDYGSSVMQDLRQLNF